MTIATKKSRLLGMEDGCCQLCVCVFSPFLTERERKIISFRGFAFAPLGFGFAKY